MNSTDEKPMCHNFGQYHTNGKHFQLLQEKPRKVQRGHCLEVLATGSGVEVWIYAAEDSQRGEQRWRTATERMLTAE